MIQVGTHAHFFLSLIVAAPLVYAGVAKLMDPSHFVSGLPLLRLEVPAVQRSGRLVGLIELAIGAGVLLIPSWEAATLSALTYSAFALVLGRALRGGAQGDCGCFGALPNRIDTVSVARNLMLAAGALFLAAGRLVDVFGTYEMSNAVAAAVSLLLVSAALDTLLSVRRRVV